LLRPVSHGRYRRKWELSVQGAAPSPADLLGTMRCLHALGEWEELRCVPPPAPPSPRPLTRQHALPVGVARQQPRAAPGGRDDASCVALAPPARVVGPERLEVAGAVCGGGGEGGVEPAGLGHDGDLHRAPRRAHGTPRASPAARSPGSWTGRFCAPSSPCTTL